MYVDDIILGGRSELKLKAVKRELSERFKMKDLAQLLHIQDWFTGLIWIRTTFIYRKVLHQFGMIECKPVSTPTNSDIKPTSASLEDVCNQKEY